MYKLLMITSSSETEEFTNKIPISPIRTTQRCFELFDTWTVHSNKEAVDHLKCLQ